MVFKKKKMTSLQGFKSYEMPSELFLIPVLSFMADVKASTGGPFHRRPTDKRLVRSVVSIAHAPTNWVPMDIQVNLPSAAAIFCASKYYYNTISSRCPCSARVSVCDIQ